MKLVQRYRAGFSLVEVIVVIMVVTIVFGGLFVSFEYSLRLIGQSKAKMTALALMNDRLEYIRSLPYDSVGTVAGIPSGAIPQNRTVSLNGISFNERVLVEFVDDPSDGLSGADTNSIISDYKRIKIEYTWTTAGVANAFSTASNIVPRSIETTAGGGTLRVNVFNAVAAPLSGVSVRLLNTTTTSTIDVTRFTGADGSAIFTGAPAAANYQIFVSAPGYSSDQTRVATTSLPNPATLPVAVLESDVSTMNFQIDRLSTTTIKFLSSQTINYDVDLFDDLSGVATSTNVALNGSRLELSQTAGVYQSSGLAWLNPLTPATIINWGVVKMDSVISSDTDLRIQFYSSSSDSDLIPEADLPGNAIGFSSEYIDLRNLNGTTYPTLVPRVTFTTTDTTESPQLRELEIPFVESEVPIVGETVGITGSKIIGTNGAASIPKFVISTTTSASGQINLYGIEWDQYQLTLSGGRIIREACPSSPFTVSPNSSTTIRIIASPSSADNLRVAVKDASGVPIIGATVLLTRLGYSGSLTAGWCGQVFFSGLDKEADYTLSVSASGYTSSVLTPFTVDGTGVQEIILAP